MITVSIIIPNWNGRSLLEKHLPQVLSASKGSEIIIVDDCSIDDSVAFIRTHYPSITLIVKNSHEGFSSTVNRGVGAAHGDIVILLNTDVEPDKNFLIPLLPHFEDTHVFAVGCLEKSIEGGKTILRGRGLAKWSKGFYSHSRGEVNASDTAWVSGGSGAFRKSYWKRLGGLDEVYNPFYWEDIDICYRAQKSGYRLVFEPKSIVTHYHEIGKIKTEFTDNHIQTIAYRNQFIFIWKNITDRQRMRDHFVWSGVRGIQAILRLDWAFINGCVAALLKLPSILKKRTESSGYFIKKDSELA